MIFNSFLFVAFWVIVLLLLIYFSKATERTSISNILLLCSSYYFYGSFSFVFLLLLIYVSVLNYCAGFLISKKYHHKKLILGIDVILTLLPLLFFKYIEFILTNLNKVFSSNIGDGLIGNIILPVGISFFTLQTLTYTIDIYRQKITPTHNILNFALFVSFFPTILSGPIERARNLLPQIEKHRVISLNSVVSGVSLFVWGLFKKVVIADRLAQYVDWTYGSVEYVSGSSLALAAVFYSIQIYCDFSGYSDMAIGVARSMGFDVIQNFKFPYFAHSIKEFWHRWHISLTSWFTEYVYFPLGGSRVKTHIRWIFNISMVFVLSGIWHGAAWGFLFWGVLHAILYLLEHGLHLQPKEDLHWWRYVKTLYVFFFATIAWVLFRVNDITVSLQIIIKSLTELWTPINFGPSTFQTVETIALLLVFCVLDFCTYKKWLLKSNDNHHVCGIINLGYILSLLLGISLFGVTSSSFVYFQF
ncbi:MAG: MBOAT family protein [Bacteroidaceae bacterium]|nr:MBOAT family protein [Bacteroidaceae bacterium]